MTVNLVRIFKYISLLEGISFILLLAIAMPLKYYYNMPEAVSMVGMAHGILFVLYLIGAFYMYEKLEWSLKTFGIVVFCSIVPFGPFYVDRKYL